MLYALQRVVQAVRLSFWAEMWRKSEHMRKELHAYMGGLLDGLRTASNEKPAIIHGGLIHSLYMVSRGYSGFSGIGWAFKGIGSVWFFRVWIYFGSSGLDLFWILWIRIFATALRNWICFGSSDIGSGYGLSL